MKLLINKRKEQDLKGVSIAGANNRLFRKPIFDTKNYYFYYTEIWKEKYRPKY
jgi:hypothetical protein